MVCFAAMQRADSAFFVAMNLVCILLYILSVSGGSSDEKKILLEFKKSVSDPHGIFSSWNAGSSDYCSWFGVSCNSNLRVSWLKIEGNFSVSHQCSMNSVLALHGFEIRRNCTEMNGKIVGKLPPIIGKLKELKVLSLPFNELRGEIPVQIWSLKNLEVLDLEGNLIVGNFSDYEFTGLRNLRVLNLAYNMIAGKFPPSLAICRVLRILNLAGNEINGVIPRFIGGFRKLRVLNLSFNQLVGHVPDNLGCDCGNLEHLDLSVNFLKGEIPRALGNCSHLRTLLVSSNALSGFIPMELGELRNLEVLDVSRNRLSGPLPEKLGNCINLSVLVLSSQINVLPSKRNPGRAVSPRLADVALEDYNCFDGFIPIEITTLPKLQIVFASGANFEGPTNWGRCARQKHAPSESRSHPKSGKNRVDVIFEVCVISVAVVIAVVLVFVFCYAKRKISDSKGQNTMSPQRRETNFFEDIGVPLTYDGLIQATGNFNISNCIGNGGFGATYRAEVSPGMTVAVKRLITERCQGIPQFCAEVRTLRRIKHPNLITLIGYGASQAEMFLIYNYLPGGNLEEFIRERARRAFDWRIVHKIALDVASALTYLHDQCNPSILHRDIKPSNILLDNDCNAYLSDFGLSKSLSATQTHATTRVAGTYGYIAPEYALTGRVSNKADVYSYGVMLLELLSDKKALDPSFYSYEDGFSIVSWACLLLKQGQAEDFFFSSLWDSGPQDDLVKMLHVAVLCTLESYSARPTMKQVVQRLKHFQPPSG